MAALWADDLTAEETWQMGQIITHLVCVAMASGMPGRAARAVIGAAGWADPETYRALIRGGCAHCSTGANMVVMRHAGSTSTIVEMFCGLCCRRIATQKQCWTAGCRNRPHVTKMGKAALYCRACFLHSPEARAVVELARKEGLAPARVWRERPAGAAARACESRGAAGMA